MLVTGDFNDTETSDCCQTFVRANFRDVYRSVHPDVSTDSGDTFHGFEGPSSKHCIRIDYIFASTHVQEIVDAQILTQKHGDLYPSDHFPVSATVVLPPHRS